MPHWGPPCQAFSYNNHAREEHATRSTLFQDYLRIVEALRPKCVVMENVPGILTILDGAVMEAIRGELSALGYECTARILYAEDYGVPQERRRVFFIASRIGPVATLFPRGRFGPSRKPSKRVNPLIHRWSLRPGQERRRAPTVWCAIGDLPAIPNGGGTDRATHTKAPACWYQVRMRQRGGASTTTSPRLWAHFRSRDFGTSAKAAIGATFRSISCPLECNGQNPAITRSGTAGCARADSAARS